MTLRVLQRKHREWREDDAEHRAIGIVAGCGHASESACVPCIARGILQAEDSERESVLGLFGRHRKVTGAAVRCARCDGFGWWLKGNHYGEADFVECMACDGTGHVPTEEL